MKKHIATVISRLFDPFTMLAVTLIILISTTAVFVPAFISMVLVPLLIFIIAVKTRFVSNWDLSDRKERPKLLWPLVVIEIICIYIFQLFTLIPILFVMCGFVIITHYWKISGHAMASAVATAIFVEKFGIAWWPVLLIVPLVSWARVVRHDHTIWQVIAGAVYSWSLLILFGKIFNF